MVESVMFLGFSLCISIIPYHKKNFNKLCLFGAFLYCISMLLQGPLVFINVPLLPKSKPISWVASGVAVGGIGGAFIMPAVMSALMEVTEGLYPPSKDNECQSAMGSLISLSFGIGNFLGTMCGGYF